MDCGRAPNRPYLDLVCVGPVCLVLRAREGRCVWISMSGGGGGCGRISRAVDGPGVGLLWRRRCEGWGLIDWEGGCGIDWLILLLLLLLCW